MAGTQPSLIPLYNSINLKSHNGWDFSVKCQDNHVIHGGKCEEVYCNVTGVNLTVSYIQKDDKGGYGINAIDEQGNKYCWWHFDSISPIIFVGNKLSFGQVLGIAGNTGMSTGAHLHFGYYPYGENKDNGYGGAVSPEPFYDNRFCLDIKTQIEILQKLIEFYKSLVSLWKKT